MSNNKTNNRNKKKQIVVKKRNQLGDLVQLAQSLPKVLEKTVSQNKNVDAVSKEAIRFATAYADPFSNKPASLPIGPANPHQPIIVRTAVTGTTNASGIGWAILRVAGMVDNSFPCLSASISTSADTPGWATNASANSDSPYVRGDFSPAAENHKLFRVVSAGLRARYVGTNLNKAGMVWTYQLLPPLQASFDDGVVGMSIDDVKKSGVYKETTFSNNSWHAVTRHVTSLEDMLYQEFDAGEQQFKYAVQSPSTPLAATSFDNTSTLLILIKTEANQPFEVEASGHFEIVGNNLPTRSYAPDERKFVLKIKDAYSNRRFKDHVTKDHSVNVAPTAKSGWLDVLKTAATTAIPLIPQLVSMFL